MARFLLLTIIAFIALTFLMTFLKGALRRAMNTQPPRNASQKQASANTTSNNDAHTAAQKELYRSNDVVVLQGEAVPSESPKYKV